MLRLMLRRRLSTMLLVLLLIGSAACALKNAQQISIGVYNVLATVQDTEAQMFTDGLIDAADHQTFNQTLVVALEAEQAYNRAVMAGGTGDLTDLRAAVTELADVVVTLTSLDDTTRARLQASVDFAVTLITGEPA